MRRHQLAYSSDSSDPDSSSSGEVPRSRRRPRRREWHEHSTGHLIGPHVRDFGAVNDPDEITPVPPQRGSAISMDPVELRPIKRPGPGSRSRPGTRAATPTDAEQGRPSNNADFPSFWKRVSPNHRLAPGLSKDSCSIVSMHSPHPEMDCPRFGGTHSHHYGMCAPTCSEAYVALFFFRGNRSAWVRVWSP